MRRKVYKRKPKEYWRIPEYEGWLEKLAKEGLHLRDIGYRMEFESGTPDNLTYRIDIIQSIQEVQKKCDTYEEQGWEFVTSDDKLAIFRAPEELGLKELYTKPKEQEKVLKELQRSLKARATLMGIGVFICFIIGGCCINLGYKQGGIILALMNISLITPLVVIVAYGYECCKAMKAVRYLERLKKELQEGKWLEHAVEEKKWCNRLTFGWVLRTICIGILMMALVWMWEDEKIRFQDVKEKLPIVRIEEIEEEPIQPAGDYNFYEVTTNLLAKKIYESEQEAKVPEDHYIEPEDKYIKIELETELYDLRFKFMAKRLMNDLINKYTKQLSSEEFIEVENSSVDELCVVKTANRIKTFGRKDNKVMYLEYRGRENEGKLIKEMVEKLCMYD